jgi:glycosyltransferase involved in cell wall biosynthesis
MKLAALVPFPFINLEFGGAERILNLLTRVDAEIDVFVPNYGKDLQDKYKNLNLNYVLVPESSRLADWDETVAKSANKLFASKIAQHDLIILEHPWQVSAIQGQTFIYDAHNNETALKQALSKQSLVQFTNETEGIALEADHVTFCSLEDSLVTTSPMTHIPNGTEIPKHKNKHGADSNVLFFMGSNHPPNIGAAITLAQLAAVLPDYQIVIAGKCTDNIEVQTENVTVLSHMGADLMDYLMRTSHAFLNLIAAGSGTSLKVARAMSYGLPIISSKIGARGYDDGVIIANNAKEVLESLAALKNKNNYQLESGKALNAAEQYSWDKIGAKFNQVVQEMM